MAGVTSATVCPAAPITVRAAPMVVVVAVTALVVWRVYTQIRGADARAREWVECDQVDC